MENGAVRQTIYDFLFFVIVNIALSCTVFALNNIVTLKSGLEVTQGPSN